MQAREGRHSPPSRTQVLTVSGGRLSQGGSTVLDRVELAVAAGEVHGLSGSPRAMDALVQALAGGGDATLEGGRVEVDGRVVELTAPGRGRELGLRVVGPWLGDPADPTIAEALLPGAEAAGGPGAGAAAAFLQALGLGHLEPARRLTGLSVHDRLLIEIARAAAGAARLVVLDLPAIDPDSEEAGLLHEVLGRLVGRGVALLLVTSRPQDIRDLCDQFTLLLEVGGGTHRRGSSRPVSYAGSRSQRAEAAMLGS